MDRGAPSGPDPIDDLLHAHLVAPARADDGARTARIADEAREAFRALAHARKAVSLFGFACSGPLERWGGLARDTAGAPTRAGFAVITGGGSGIMEAANAAAHGAGGPSIGLTIDLSVQEEPNPHLSLRVPFHYFFLRKLAFVKYSCAFVCLPGGFGTLDELFEALNLKLTHKMDPFPVILVGRDYWAGLFDWLEEVVVGAGALAREDLGRSTSPMTPTPWLPGCERATRGCARGWESANEASSGRIDDRFRGDHCATRRALPRTRAMPFRGTRSIPPLLR